MLCCGRECTYRANIVGRRTRYQERSFRSEDANAGGAHGGGQCQADPKINDATHPVVSPLRSVYIQPSSDITITRVASRERQTDTLVEGGSNKHASFDGAATRTSDQPAGYSARSEEQVIQERKITASKCEVEQSQPNSNPTSQERTDVAVSPQVQQTVTTVTAKRCVCFVP